MSEVAYLVIHAEGPASLFVTNSLNVKWWSLVLAWQLQLGGTISKDNSIWMQFSYQTCEKW